MLNQNWITDEIKLIIKKIDDNMEIFGTKFPNREASGIYSQGLNEDGNWTGSFWTGMVFLAYKYTGDKKYIDYLRRYLPIYQWRLKEGYKDHDLGFLYQLYGAILYKETGEQAFKDLTVEAAEELLKRYNPKGKFIRAWGRLDEEYRSGKMIVDCMMNLPLLYSASKITGDNRYFDAAINHADTTAQYNVREDYSVYHTYDFDPQTGEPIGGFNEGGYADESCWSRGHAWTIYGFVLAYRHTGNEKYLTLVKHLIAYFTFNLGEDLVPIWDFKIPEDVEKLRDTSASSLVAAALLELSELLEGSEDAKAYRDFAVKMLKSMKDNYSAAADQSVQGIMPKCFGRINGVNSHIYSVWGDYYYLEALMKAAGYKTDMWSF